MSNRNLDESSVAVLFVKQNGEVEGFLSQDGGRISDAGIERIHRDDHRGPTTLLCSLSHLRWRAHR